MRQLENKQMTQPNPSKKSPAEILAALRAANLGRFTHFMVFDDDGPWNPICFDASNGLNAMKLAQTFNGYKWELYSASDPPQLVFKI